MIELQVCTQCQSAHYPQRDICPSCWQDTLEWKPVSPAGRVTSFTDLHISARAGWEDKLPLCLGLVKLDTGPNVLAILSGKVTISMPVTLVFSNGIFTAKEQT